MDKMPSSVLNSPPKESSSETAESILALQARIYDICAGSAEAKDREPISREMINALLMRFVGNPHEMQKIRSEVEEFDKEQKSISLLEETLKAETAAAEKINPVLDQDEKTLQYMESLESDPKRVQTFASASDEIKKAVQDVVARYEKQTMMIYKLQSPESSYRKSYLEKVKGIINSERTIVNGKKILSENSIRSRNRHLDKIRQNLHTIVLSKTDSI